MDIIFPPPLKFGDLIGVVSPASSPFGKKNAFLDRGLNYFLKNGYRLLEGEHLRDEYGYLAGSDDARANDLNCMIRNPDVKAIFCSRGGFAASGTGVTTIGPWLGMAGTKLIPPGVG